MKTLLLTMASLAALVIAGCFSDGVMNPPANTETDTSNLGNPIVDDPWQDALDRLAQSEEGAALIEEMSHLIEKARASGTAPTVRDNSNTRFFLAFERTTIEVVPPFPPPILTLEISYEGVGTILGRYTAFSLSSVDVTVQPNQQWGDQASTAANGDELHTSYAGIAVPGEGEGDVEFEGSSTVTGGTGRFDGATGTINYMGEANQIEATGTVLRWGYITLQQGGDAGPIYSLAY